MGKHKIDIDINDPNSIDEAVKAFHEATAGLDEKINRFLTELAEIGRSAAEQTDGSAIDVTVQKSGDDEWVIRASGDAVVFFEFGAGKATDSGERYAKEMPFRVEVGSYSDENGGEFAASGYQFWHFGGRPYSEIKQRPGMLRAYEAIKMAIPETAKRVFG